MASDDTNTEKNSTGKKAGQGQLEFDPETPPWLQPASEGDPQDDRKWWMLGGGAVAIIVLVLVLAFVGGLFFVQRDSQDGPPRIVEAPNDPIRVKPESPGGLEVAHQDKEVLNNDTDSDQPVSLGPQPEQPVEKLDDAIEQQQAVQADKTPEAMPNGVELTENKTQNDTAATDNPAQADTVEDAEPAPPAEPQTAETAPVLPPQGPVFRVQLGAFGTRASAEAAWQRTLRVATDSLRGAEPSYETVQLPDRSLIRLRTGAFATRDEADALCTALKDLGLPCLVVNP